MVLFMMIPMWFSFHLCFHCFFFSGFLSILKQTSTLFFLWWLCLVSLPLFCCRTSCHNSSYLLHQQSGRFCQGEWKRMMGSVAHFETSVSVHYFFMSSLYMKGVQVSVINWNNKSERGRREVVGWWTRYQVCCGQSCCKI